MIGHDDTLPADLLLRAGILVPQDGERRVIDDAGLAVKGSAIAAVGPWNELAATPAREFLDCSGDVVLPGLVNAHTHAAMTVFRGLGDDLPLMEWLSGRIWPAEARLSAEIVEIGTTLACAEMLAGGTTTFNDQYIFARDVARAVHAAGMRCVLGEGVFDTPNASYATMDQAFERVAALEDSCRDKPLLTTCLVAHSVYATGHETLKRLAAMRRASGGILTLHAAENAQETALCLERFGKRPLAVLDGLGLLEPGLLLAHCVQVEAAEALLLAERGVAVAHCPRSNMKLASGMAPVTAMRRAGVRMGLGTDGAASNNALNMFSEMGAAALLAKVCEGDPTALPARDVLDMATREGAAALGLDNVGALAPGMQADLIALRRDHPALQPGFDPVSDLVYAAHAAPVRLTMAAGRVLYKDGRHLTIDRRELDLALEGVRQWARGG
ncbi:5-methylthioadenosine/S-adenosylhomocysteine deaminase [Fundidesulfovibrio magnetotacticus]|uniref:5-methylthioadenosine/S-adenosylhomocysteine deaminase n=1 Tax=Fundidesulfovibrio magnetotacticus TaxID=2730080 RepID=A0A6V8LX50_9BACT|nr:amidohydrolase [Fundidesulfovibrio magnetotacticus]GFK95161.1 5-methylthioadenosine/S-adenosylhomocysteine deaminase [Fundidesulfovibrio magnetotacticus]